MSPTAEELARIDREHLIHPLHHPIDNANIVIYVRGRGVTVQDLEQTPLPLSALDHARSFAAMSRAGSLVRQIDRRNRRINRFVIAGCRPSVPVSDLGGHFFTEK